ncbi:MAG TPA: ABC transporter substrate-binding protein [Planctomycetota bacterium]|nr:ABC transporter substrate-binding protein [Planctomycetota bacterium]
MIVVVVIAAGATAAWWAMRHRSLVAVRLAVSSIPMSAGIFLAEARDAYREHGVDVRITVYGSGKEALAAVLSNEADIATVAQTPLMHAVLAGERVAVWATIAEVQKSQRIVARSDRGIRQASDLDGKTIAVPRGTSAEVYVLSYLRYHGIDPARVTMIDATIESLAESLASGAVDAVCVWDPYASRIQEAMPEATVLEQDSLYQFSWNLVGRPELSGGRAVDGCLAALVEVTPDLQRLDPSEFATIAGRCGLTAEQLTAALGSCHYRIQLDASLAIALESDAAHLYGDQASQRAFADILDAGPLRRVDPTAAAVDW